MSPERKHRHSLTNVGGPALLSGLRPQAKILERILSVQPQEKLPFTHGFHAYPARMHPEIARRTLEEFRTGAVLDPFMGSGTVALEAVRAGRPFTGIDVSRIAVEIAWTRTRVLPKDQAERVASEAAGISKRADKRMREGVTLPGWAIREKDWYPLRTLREIVALHAEVEGLADVPLRRLLMCVLSSLLVKLSRQKSDSVTFMDPGYKEWPPGTPFRFFRDKARELAENYATLAVDLRDRKVKPVEPTLTLADARRVELKPESFDLVLTSPPYAGTYDYAKHHERRYPLYGETGRLALDHEIGSRREVHDDPTGPGKFRDDLAAVLANAMRALKKGGKMLVLAADGFAGGRPIKTEKVIELLAPEIGGRWVCAAAQWRNEWTYGREGKKKLEHMVMLDKP